MKGRFLASLPLLGLAFAVACAPETPEPAPRNLVVLVIDTLRANHLSSYGYFRRTSPRIDQLAHDGALFEDSYAHSNWTVPATASLLTSLLPCEHGAGLEGEIRLLDDQVPLQLRKDVKTIAGFLSAAGFATGLFSANPFLYGRFKEGFDVADVGRQSATSLTDKSVDWLRTAASGRFFLYVHYMDLHQPLEPPEPYFSLFEVAAGGERNDSHRNWSYGRLADPRAPDFQRYKAHRVALYDGALRYVDHEIGRLLDALEELGSAEETLVVVTSDHGEEFWDHAEMERELGGDPRNMWGIGHGHSMFQELVRVPLIFSGPGVSSQRQECRVRHLDVVPTVLEMLAVETPDPLRGKSLAALLGEPQAPCRPAPAVAESPAYGPDTQTLIWKRHKLIRRHGGRDLLFDLETDPREMHDLSATQPELAARLTEILNRALVTPPSGHRERMEIDDATRDQLRALGYLDQ